MEQSKIYYTTIEFAELCNVSKNTLCHYDKIGLFSPEIKNESNNVKYSIFQIETFNVIHMLKELNMTLEEIKDYLENKNPENFLSILKDKSLSLDIQIKKLKQLKLLIDNKINVTLEGSNATPSLISIESFEEETLFTTESTVTPKEISLGPALSSNLNVYKEPDLFTLLTIGEILSVEDVIKGSYFNYKCFYTNVNNSKNNENIHIKEAGKYLVTYHRGGYYSIKNAYNSLLKYIEENNLVISSDFYEDTLLDELSVNGNRNSIIKISVKIL